MNSLGILAGCDRNQEWLLVWWYSHLRKHHPDLPIAFGDFGMSEEGLQWCEQRGTVIPASSIPPLPESMGRGWPLAGEKWVQRYLLSDSLKPQRPTWFRKPLLMKQSPFERTLWLDLDCQVLNSLSPILSLPLNSSKMAIGKSGNSFSMIALESPKIFQVKIHNSGVVLFEKNSPLLDFWIFLLSQESLSFDGDDQLLSFGIQQYRFTPTQIPCNYNWNYKWGPNPEAAICHYEGEGPKNGLRLSMAT